MLKIKDLSVEINNKKILKDFNLTINMNEIHGIMGPNGVGKSTICKTIIGDPSYLVTEGEMIFNSSNLLKLDITARAREGIYLVNQSPIEIPGVTNSEMLRIALAEKNGQNVNLYDFNKKMESICEKLAIPKSFIHRGINEGMSGGERKKNELLHLWMLEPKLILLDELDSGLDVDSIKVVCENIKEYRKTHNVSILIITHHAKLLKLLEAQRVHIISDGTIIKSGDLSLALEIEQEGYKSFSVANKVSENSNHE